MSTENKLEIQAGDDEPFAVVFKDSDGNAIDISGWTLKFKADDLINIEVTNHDDPANGETSFTISGNTTENIRGTSSYDYELWYIDENSNKRTIMHGRITVE